MTTLFWTTLSCRLIKLPILTVCYLSPLCIIYIYLYSLSILVFVLPSMSHFCLKCWGDACSWTRTCLLLLCSHLLKNQLLFLSLRMIARYNIQYHLLTAQTVRSRNAYHENNKFVLSRLLPPWILSFIIFTLHACMSMRKRERASMQKKCVILLILTMSILLCSSLNPIFDWTILICRFHHALQFFTETKW